MSALDTQSSIATESSNLRDLFLLRCIAIGGQIIGGGNIPIVVPGVFPNGLPAIATGAVAGIVLNLIFLLFSRGDED